LKVSTSATLSFVTTQDAKTIRSAAILIRFIVKPMLFSGGTTIVQVLEGAYVKIFINDHYFTFW
jgi:hypothetical protein